MSNSNLPNPYANLSLIAFWQDQLTPALPLLADISHVSISQVRHALPHLLKVLTLQVQQSYISQSSHAQSNQLDFIATIKNDTLPNLPLQNLAENIAKNGLNYALLPKIVNFTQTAQQILFSDPLFYQQILGILVQRTGLTVSGIEILLAWTSLLCLISLHNLAKNVDMSELKNWLSAQSEIGFNANDNGLLAMYHQQFYTNATTRFEQFYHFSKSNFTTLLSQPTQRQLFALAPVKLKTAVTKPVLLSSSQAFIENNHFSSHKTLPLTETIFTPKVAPKFSLAKILQKYWIATSIVLTGLVFGVVALFSANSPKPTPETVASTEKPIHDVAIMKVESSPASTASPAIANPKVTPTSKTISQSTPKVASDTHSKESNSIASKSKSDPTAVFIKAKPEISAKAKTDNTKVSDKKAVTSPTKTTEKSDNKKEASKKTK